MVREISAGSGWLIYPGSKKKNSWPTSTKGFLGSPVCLQLLTRNFIFPWTEKSPLLPSTPWSLRSFWKFASVPETIPWFLTKGKQRSFSAKSPHREDTFLFFPPRQTSHYRRSEFLTEHCPPAFLLRSFPMLVTSFSITAVLQKHRVRFMES